MAGARQGIFFKGGTSLERAGRQFDLLAFDKTGTLTTGNMEVSSFRMMDSAYSFLTEEDLVGLLAKIETYVQHPVGMWQCSILRP
jgi:P-type E1-E2 ATPase